MRLNKVYITKITWWLAFVWASASPLAILAQPSSESFSTKFRRVLHLDEITGDGAYLIGAEYEVGLNDQIHRGFCLMSAMEGRSTLLGAKSEYPLVPVLDVKQEHFVWNFQKEAGGFVLYSPWAQKGISLKKNAATSLVMSAYEWEKWQISEREQGNFVLQSQTDVSRAIGLNWYNESKINFGLYKYSSDNPMIVHIYKQIVNVADLPGEAMKPADGSSVTLVAGQQVLMGDGETATFNDASSYLLEDGTLAYDELLPHWACRHVANDAFMLVNDNGDGLEQLVEGLLSGTEWRIDNGHVVTNESEPRYLVRLKDGGLTLVTRKMMAESAVSPVVLLPMGETPRVEMGKHGVAHLVGSWSAHRLSDLDWTDIQILDLTEIKLPVQSFIFNHRPNKSNALTMVSEKTKVDYLRGWHNVVECAAQGTNIWKNKDELNDRVNWTLDRKIQVAEGLLTYRRAAYADGKWETICVPFDADVPQGFEVFRFDKVENDEVLIFKRSQKIVADVPMLIRYIGPAVADDCVDLVLLNKAGELNPSAMDRSGFFGNYVPYEVTVADQGIYLLNQSGDTFARAAASSRLAPFRAAFATTAEARSLQLKCVEAGATGITASTADSPHTSCYTIDGKLISSDFSSEDYDRLPKGVYLIDGKKYLK